MYSNLLKNMVVDAVCGEPVSARSSLLRCEIQGIFAI